ncbi:uncharacterized protein [Apostichopus japonicus]|uniref:uncharacterized protein isoform X2 n=1 Tax=Stichopus japonicus TaxID=307972 RepID=UPI003AB2411E
MVCHLVLPVNDRLCMESVICKQYYAANIVLQSTKNKALAVMKLFIHPTTKRGPSVILLDINEDLQSCPENTEEDVREELEAGEEKEQEDEAADFFTVEKVLKKRQKKGKTEYLVTWQESRRKRQKADVNPR